MAHMAGIQFMSDMPVSDSVRAWRSPADKSLPLRLSATQKIDTVVLEKSVIR